MKYISKIGGSVIHVPLQFAVSHLSRTNKDRHFTKLRTQFQDLITTVCTYIPVNKINMASFSQKVLGLVYCGAIGGIGYAVMKLTSVDTNTYIEVRVLFCVQQQIFNNHMLKFQSRRKLTGQSLPPDVRDDARKKQLEAHNNNVAILQIIKKSAGMCCPHSSTSHVARIKRTSMENNSMSPKTHRTRQEVHCE